jgi:hypothetical protein
MSADSSTQAAAAARPTPRRAVGVGLGVVGSLLIHASLVAIVLSYGTAPTLGFELQLPTEIEFGMSGGMELTSAPPPAPVTPPPAPVTPAAAGEDGAGASDGGAPMDGGDPDAGRRRRRDGGSDASIDDAAIDDAGVEEDASVEDDAATSDPALLAAADSDGGAAADAGPALLAAADSDGGAGNSTGGSARPAGPGLAAYAPPGAQLALRLDLVRVRQSPLAPDVRALLASVPDWQALLDGSGIEPLDDLERLLIASPNLQRERLVMSGRYVGDETKVREAVARMAAARGEPVRWRRERGFDVARWPNADVTERVIALVGPQAFTITRTEDLPRVLAVARERRREAERLARAAGTPALDDAEALLSMEEGVVLSFEVEGARAFVRGPTENMPVSARASVRELPTARVEIVAVGQFETAEQASTARDFWDHMRASYARNALVSLVGLGSALDQATLDVEGSALRFRTELTPRQITLVLRYARSMFERPRVPPGGGPPTAPPLPPIAPRRPP